MVVAGAKWVEVGGGMLHACQCIHTITTHTCTGLRSGGREGVVGESAWYMEIERASHAGGRQKEKRGRPASPTITYLLYGREAERGR